MDARVRLSTWNGVGSPELWGWTGSRRSGGEMERSAAGERTSPPSLPLEGPGGPAWEE